MIIYISKTDSDYKNLVQSKFSLSGLITIPSSIIEKADIIYTRDEDNHIVFLKNRYDLSVSLDMIKQNSENLIISKYNERV